MTRSALHFVLLVALASGSKSSPALAVAPRTAGDWHVDLSLIDDLTGEGGVFRVVWYHRGPFNNPQTERPGYYVRGVAVEQSGQNPHTLDKWESELTTLPDSYKQFNNLWPLRGGHGALITALTQFGGTVYVLDAFRFQNGKLQRVKEVGGRGIWLETMGRSRRPVIIVRPSDETELRQLFDPETANLARVDREFPDFWVSEGRSYAEQMRDPNAWGPQLLSLLCKLTFEAYGLAQRPEAAKEPCLWARKKILQLDDRSPKQDKVKAVSEIDLLMSKAGGRTSPHSQHIE